MIQVVLYVVDADWFCRMLDITTVNSLPSNDLRDSIILCDVSKKVLLESEGERNRLKFDGVAICRKRGPISKL